MERKVIASYEEWKEMEGQQLGYSNYMKITQERINDFAKATGDFQWIHTDPKKAELESPFKKTIAHGYLTVSLLPTLLDDILEVNNSKLTVNYMVEKLKFNQAVVVDSNVRLKVSVKEVKDLRGIAKVTLNVTLEIENEKKPAYTGSAVLLYHF